MNLVLTNTTDDGFRMPCNIRRRFGLTGVCRPSCWWPEGSQSGKWPGSRGRGHGPSTPGSSGIFVPTAPMLADASRSGRPRVARTITDARIKHEIRRDPLRLGYNTTGWTVALLAKHLSQKYECSISARTLRRRMHGLGLRWKRPRYAYLGKDPNRAQKKGGSFAA